MDTDMTYWIAAERMEGQIGGNRYTFRAFSGGGRGSVKYGVSEYSIASYSPYRRMIHKTQRGGAIPPGVWRIEDPREKGDSKGVWVAVLTPSAEVRKLYPQRDFDIERFKIHGNGPNGSDGCIVILPGDRLPFLKAVKKAGGASLTVVWDGDRMEERLQIGRRLQNLA